MRFERAAVARPVNAPRAWLDVARVVVAFASVTGAFWVATHARLEREYFVLVLAAGLVVFAASLVALGRDVAARWVAFGSQLGFAPASRRPLLDVRTDRPVLHGSAGRHSARLRLVLARRDAWLQAEIDLLADDERTRARAWRAGASVRDGRLVMREPFQGLDATQARAFLDRAASTADALLAASAPDAAPEPEANKQGSR